MKQRALYAEAGYADLVLPRIMATIVLVLVLITIPAYLEHEKRNKLIPVLNALQFAVEEHYKENKQLPDFEKMTLIAEHEYVDAKEKLLRINLSLINKDVAGQYLQLQPLLESDNITWKCTFIGDVYKNDIPDLDDNICRESRLTLQERSFTEQIWVFMKAISSIILAYILFVGFTFLFG